MLAAFRGGVTNLFETASYFLSVTEFETWSRSRDTSRDPLFEVSVSKFSGFVSVLKDFGLGLELFVSRLCIGYFL